MRQLNSCDMMPLRVSDAIQSIAEQCDELASQIHVVAAPSIGSPSQPSVAAIATSHAIVAGAAATLSARLTATGRKIFEADRSYGLQDAYLAAALSEQSV